jgi:hypothetical protein
MGLSYADVLPWARGPEVESDAIGLDANTRTENGSEFRLEVARYGPEWTIIDGTRKGVAVSRRRGSGRFARVMRRVR